MTFLDIVFSPVHGYWDHADPHMSFNLYSRPDCLIKLKPRKPASSMQHGMTGWLDRVSQTINHMLLQSVQMQNLNIGEPQHSDLGIICYQQLNNNNNNNNMLQETLICCKYLTS